jgi:hypothetical protein
MRRLACLAALAAALVLPQSAQAGYWVTWTWITPGTYGGCMWYSPGSVCSGWNYWYLSDALLTGSDPGGQQGQLHCGFQTNSMIRGAFVWGPGSTCQVYDTDVAMGGVYKKVSHTWWQGASLYGEFEGYA